MVIPEADDRPAQLSSPEYSPPPLAELVTRNAELAPQYLKTIPLGRFAQPSDVAKCVLFLASDESAYVTGHTIVIDGGQTLGIPGSLEDAAG